MGERSIASVSTVGKVEAAAPAAISNKVQEYFGKDDEYVDIEDKEFIDDQIPF